MIRLFQLNGIYDLWEATFNDIPQHIPLVHIRPHLLKEILDILDKKPRDEFEDEYSNDITLKTLLEEYYPTTLVKEILTRVYEAINVLIESIEYEFRNNSYVTIRIVSQYLIMVEGEK